MENIIEFLKYLALGLIQGITEPLPISSSGHMVILDSIFGEVISSAAMNNFQIIVNFASLLAIIFFYRKLLKELISGSIDYVFKKDQSKKPKFLYIVYVLIASIPAGIVGIIIKIYDLDTFFTNILVVGICLFITGLLLLYIHSIAKDATREEVTLKDGILMGSAQVIGLLPGISRSGVTSSFGVSNRLSLISALRFSFMMYIPASFGAFLIGIYDLIKEGTSSIGYFPGYIGAFFASLFGTYFAISLFFKLVKNKNLKYFSFYCITLSIIVLILISFGVF
ncbi:MAG: UDP pyrophosphate phosphatase [Bacilli bacterium]|nr:UDP pyrophosphate phosphatase [Bacilli bacterium]